MRPEEGLPSSEEILLLARHACILLALELAHNANHSSTELSPFEVIIGENPLTATDFHTVGALSPTLTSPMTKLCSHDVALYSVSQPATEVLCGC